jgi:hypothetical protein
VEWLLVAVTTLVAFLFLLEDCTVGAAAGHMGCTRQQQFPFGQCVLTTLLPSAAAFGVPWLFGQEIAAADRPRE